MSNTINKNQALDNYLPETDHPVVTDILKRFVPTAKVTPSRQKALTADDFITLLKKPAMTLPTIAELITDFMRDELGFYVPDDALAKHSLTKHNDELYAIAKTWQAFSYYEMFRQMQLVIGRDISWRINDAFIERLDHHLDLHPEYAQVQMALNETYGIDLQTSTKLCDEVLVYLQDKAEYHNTRAILDKHGLSDLPYHRFMAWWALPTRQAEQSSGDDKVINELRYPLQHQLYGQPYDFSPEQSQALIDELLANNVKRGIDFYSQGDVPMTIVVN